MKVKIGNAVWDKFTEVNVNLIYDSIASTFSLCVYFNPDNALHRAALQPGVYPEVVITHNQELILTGTLLSYKFKSSATKQLVAIAGYSKTGVLEDCQIPPNMTMQTNGMSLAQIATQLIKPFGLKLVIDPTVAAVCNQPINSINSTIGETIKSYLSDIAGQYNVVISHTNKGELLFTGYKTKTLTDPGTIVNNSVTPLDSSISGANSVAAAPASLSNRKPAADYTNGMPGVEFEQEFNGQKMHSSISVVGQAAIDGGNAAEAEPLKNPYVGKISVPLPLNNQNDIDNAQIYVSGPTVYRPKVTAQTTGTYLTTDKAQRNVLSDELKAMPLRIDIRGWRHVRSLALPGDIITVTNTDLHIYKPARFFVESVQYKDGKVKEVCTLNCVVEETFNNDVPVNIFL